MPRTVSEILDQIRSTADCAVHPAVRREGPAEIAVESPDLLPADLHEFARLCGGVDLFVNSPYPLFIHGASSIQSANPVLIGEPCTDDRSYHWFLIANDGNGDYLSIDLSEERSGRCHDSFFDCHAVAGSCAIVATSFTDLLERALNNAGQRWWWLREDFVSLGDAYDD